MLTLIRDFSGSDLCTFADLRSTGIFFFLTHRGIKSEGSVEKSFRMIACKIKNFSCMIAGLLVLCFAPQVEAQSGASNESIVVSGALVAGVELPDAPKPQLGDAALASAILSSDGMEQTPSSSQTQGSSSSDKPADTTKEKSQKEVAEEQLKAQQKQRILGVVPNFNTSYIFNAVPLTAGQKYKLAFNTMMDKAQFGIAGVVALYNQANGDPYEYGGGVLGYMKRYGATYADNFDGTMLGNAFFPSLLHQDPRYFRLGYGTRRHRLLYALATNVICKHDKTGKWEPNYSNVLGNIASGGISEIYAPASERGVALVFQNAAFVTAEGGIGSTFQEFWPDISRRFLHKDPTNGRDALNQKLRK